MKRLEKEQSPYLKHAAKQHVDWYPWSEEAFEAAEREGKPVFVSSGAVWCHWCHVMAQESFDDRVTAGMLNELFINIKLDRDQLPDVDVRLQQAVASMGNRTGWPLSVFLTPAKEPFFGGTYFPPEERQGMPSFRHVLQAVSNFYKEKRGEVQAYATRVAEALAPDPMNPEKLNEELLTEARGKMLAAFDHENGGFGTAPKFPMPGAIQFLLHRLFTKSDEDAAQAAKKMLLAMARGGFHDQLAGGFHRYSVDEAWIVPHFEKMATDNAGLLRNYIQGYSVLGAETLKSTAEDIIRFINAELTASEGGFYSSQDADVSPDDEGGYFTWTEAQLREALAGDEYEAVSRHLLHDRGHLHDSSKKVLAVNKDRAAIASEIGRSPEAVENLIEDGKRTLLARRKLRTPPFVDKTIYTSVNGLMAATYFRASMVLNDPELPRFAASSVDRILRDRFYGNRLYHSPGVQATLDDYIFLIDALIANYERTGLRSSVSKAEELMKLCKEKFQDRAEGGFFDSEKAVLGVRLKRMEDLPYPSANAVAIMVLFKLAALTGNEEYRRDAEQSLRIFAGPARTMGVHAGTYLCALDFYFRAASLQIEAAPESALAQAARSAALRTNTAIIYGPDNGRVILCCRDVCSPPVYDVQTLSELFCNQS